MTTPKHPPVQPSSQERIEDIDVATEMQGSFLEYAYSVIYSRALPDARDGLKPVQRRILFQMSEMGLRPDRGHVKSARVVGDVMGRLHPHGDSAIYDAMVRLAQDFVMRVPLVDGHGNFGTLDDGPAAARYTEARLATAALAMTENLDEDVVDFIPNYDNQLTQPAVLPAAYPNLLVNGATGIAVGMATNMAPHNLLEVVAAARHLLDNPQADVEDLMRFVPGPDLPSGGAIVGLEGIKDAYRTGRGTFKTRAKVAIEQTTARRQSLIVTELPYMVGAEKVIEKIKDGVGSKKLQGISDVADLTDRKHGLRLVIGIKTGFSANAVLEQLYRFTPLEDSFAINNVALVAGAPRTLGLVELLRVYLDHRIEVVRRRSQFRLARRQERLHLVEGLLLAILDIDEVIQVIRAADDAGQASMRLQSVFDLSSLQAEYILELRLRRLTRFSRIELEAEADSLRNEIAALTDLLADRSALLGLVGDEMDEVAGRLGTPRRTILMSSDAIPVGTAGASAERLPARLRTGVADLEIPDSPCEILLSTTGRMLRVEVDSGAPTPRPARRTKHDALQARIRTTARAQIGAITTNGRLVRFNGVDLPSVPSASIQLAAGSKAGDYLSLQRGERVLTLVDLESRDPIALGTALGTVKRIAPGAWPTKPEFEVISLKDADRVIGAAHCPDSATIVFVSSDARLLHFPGSAVRPQGVQASGMAGISLSAGSEAIFFGAIADAAGAVVVTQSASTGTIAEIDPGRTKVSLLSDFPGKGRATGGVRAHAFLKSENALRLAWVGADPALAVSTDGTPQKLPTELSRRDASGSPSDALIGSIGSAI